MKRLLICFFCAVLTAASLVILVGAQSADELPPEDTRGEWQIYLEDKLWPTVCSATTSIFGVYLMISPVLTRMNKSSGTLGGAAKQFADAIAELKSANESNKEKDAQIASLQERQRLLEDQLAASDGRFAELCRVFAIGWGADERMVKCGAAREMMKVVESYGGEKE